MNINDSIDKYFYPQMEILKHFKVPKSLCIYDVYDFREYFWYIDNMHIRLYKEIEASEYISRIIYQDKTYEHSNIKAILVEDRFNDKRKTFIFVDELKRLYIKLGKFERMYTRHFIRNNS